MTYGVFEITGPTIGILSIISFVALLLGVLVYRKMNSFLGVIPHLISIVLALVVLTTLYTAIDWNGNGGLNMIGAAILTVIVAASYLPPLEDVPGKKPSKKA